MTLVSPPDLFPVEQGEIAIGRPLLEADARVLAIRLPVENRGPSAFVPSSLTASLTDSKSRVHLVAVRGARIDADSTGEMVLEFEPANVARGLAELSILLGESPASVLDVEIGRTESRGEKVSRIGGGAMGFAAVFLAILAFGFASSADCVSGGNLPGECDETR